MYPLTTKRSRVVEIGWPRRRPLHRLSYAIKLLLRGMQRIGYSRRERLFIDKKNILANCTRLFLLPVTIINY